MYSALYSALENDAVKRTLKTRYSSFRAPDKNFNEDNLTIIFLFLKENIFCDPSLEPSRYGSNNGSQNMFLGRQTDNYP